MTVITLASRPTGPGRHRRWPGRRPRPQPRAEAPWHKAYGTTHDDQGRDIPDLQSWRHCECQIGDVHFVDTGAEHLA